MIGKSGGDAGAAAAELWGLTEHARRIEAFGDVLERLDALMPARVTVRQLLTFARLAQVGADGDLVSLSDIREAVKNLGQSIQKTYDLFLPISKGNPDALGWLEQETDADDRRRRNLILTSEGREIVKLIGSTLERA